MIHNYIWSNTPNCINKRLIINIVFQIGEGKIIMIKSEVFDEESR